MRRIGAGGMGVVYAAWDRDRRANVALKTLLRLDAAGIYRLKKEFRALANLSHENLIGLHELISVGDLWFLTMDLVEGTDFIGHVRGEAARDRADTVTGGPLLHGYLALDDGGAALPHTAGRPAPGAAPRFDEPRLRDALRQLARGVQALHVAGQLHRDLKPSNVLVTPAGKLTILDFGLAHAHTADAVYASLESAVVGTPAYMAPEQAATRSLSPATDWYSVGVMLFEALTGVVPFGGSVGELLTTKQLTEPPSPAELVGELPADLVDLCRRLLRRVPEERLGGAEVLSRLEGPLELQSVTPAGPPSRVVLVGRAHERQMLEASHARAREGPVVCRVTGPAGIGKSRLLRELVEGLGAGGGVLLAGRCHEREWVPYKALDSVVDALGRYLQHLPEADAAALMPRDVGALAHVFPVLGRVGAVQRARTRPVTPDARVLRSRAFVALKQVLDRIAARGPLVVLIDDLQWGDTDSAALLAELMLPPDAPRMLLLLAYREEDVSTSPLLLALQARRWLAHPEVQTLAVRLGPLDEDESRHLARLLLGDEPADADLHATIARESEGSPFLLEELAAHARRNPIGLAGDAATLLSARIEALPHEARRLLEVVAVSAAPLAPDVLLRVAGLGAGGARSLVTLLSARLCRSVWSRDALAVDVSHDRIRAEVLRMVTAGGRLVACHRALADTLERAGAPDAEHLAAHLEGGGADARAAELFAHAGEEAARALAFDRAVQRYRRALELGGERLPWRLALAETLAHAGRSAEAAACYLAAAEGAADPQAVDLRRRAAEHLLRSGHLDEGVEVMRSVLHATGLRLASTPRRALFSLMVLRARLRVRGWDRATPATERPATDARSLQRMDACWSVAIGLSMVDATVGAEFHARHLLYALESGDPRRLARAYAMESAHLASVEPTRHEEALELLTRAETLAGAANDDDTLGLCAMMRGAQAMFAGQWKQGLSATERALAWLDERCTDVAWTMATARRIGLVCLFYLGRIAEVARRVPIYLSEARACDDRFAESCVRSGTSVITWLMRGDSACARDELEEELERWSRFGVPLQHYLALQGVLYVDLYEGRAAEGVERLAAEWPTMERSRLLRIQALRVGMIGLRGCCAVATGTPEQLRLAARDATRLRAERLAHATAVADLIEAGLAHAERREAEAIDHLTAAATLFTEQRMQLHAACAKWRLGALLGGRDGGRLADHAERYFVAEGVADVPKLVGAIAPWPA